MSTGHGHRVDPDWDPHKATIKALYVNQNLKLEGSDGLIAHMAAVHNFTKSKSQFETRLKRWGFRKYRKSDDWKIISQKIKNRQQAGKNSDVYLNNEKIPETKVRKQLRRNDVPTMAQPLDLARRPQTPNGFEIRTPVMAIAGPHLQFPNSTSSSSRVIPTEDAQMDGEWLNHFLIEGSTTAEDFLNVMPFTLGNEDLPQYEFTDTVPPSAWTRQLPFLELILTISPQFSLESSKPQYTSIFELPAAAVADLRSVHPKMKSMLPTTLHANQAETSSRVCRNGDRFDSVLPQLLLFAIANNFVDRDHASMDFIMGFLEHQSNTRLSHLLFSSSGPASEALTEKVFLTAVKLRKTRVVDALLQQGLDPDQLVLDGFPKNVTPIIYSCKIYDIETARLLIFRKSDGCKDPDMASLISELTSALYHAIQQLWTSFQPLELVDMLLTFGAVVTQSTLAEACEHFLEYTKFRYTSEVDRRVFYLLIDHAKLDTFDWKSNHDLIMAIQRLSCTGLANHIVKIMEACTESPQGLFGTFSIATIEKMMILAAAQGDIELGQYLSRFGLPMTTRILSAAIRSEKVDMVRLVLDVGVVIKPGDPVKDLSSLLDPNLHPRFDPNPLYRPPFAEAIARGNSGILGLLEDHGYWSRCLENEHEYEAALQAACEVGNTSFIHRLLQSRPLVQNLDMGKPLLAALRAGHEVVIQDWLEVGALKDTPDNTKGDILALALEKNYTSLIRCLIDIGVGSWSSSPYLPPLIAAVKWGNHSIVKELVELGADPNIIHYKGHIDLKKDNQQRKILKYSRTALTVAIAKKDMHLVGLLLDAGADVNIVPRSLAVHDLAITALSAAVATNNIAMVDFILSIGADPDDELAFIIAQEDTVLDRLLTAFTGNYPRGRSGSGSIALYQAIQRADMVKIEKLLAAAIDTKFFLDLHHSFRNGLSTAIALESSICHTVVRRILDIVGDPDCAVERTTTEFVTERTPLLAAINTRDPRKVHLVLEAGGKIDYPARRMVRRTPLQQAAEVGSFEIVQILIQKGASANEPPARIGGATALQVAAIGGYVGIAELLLDHRADPNAPAAQRYGRTALEGAAEHGRIDMVKVLANAGVKLHGPEYESASQLAEENGHMAVHRYLKTLAREAEQAEVQVPEWTDDVPVADWSLPDIADIDGNMTSW